MKGFIGLGGNFLRAVPDTSRVEPAWAQLSLSVQIATKLNRTHLVPGESTWLLPCLGRIEIDRQLGVEQTYTTEDSTGCIRAWRGHAEPAGEQLRSELAIIAELALATLGDTVAIPWAHWKHDYALVREAISKVYPSIFHDFETRMWEPGGFHRPLGVAQRQWATPSGKAQFITPGTLDEDDDVLTGEAGRDVLQLMTLRSNDQFNTTVYGYDDRFRGVKGTRKVVFLNRNDIVRLGFVPGAGFACVQLWNRQFAARQALFRLSPMTYRWAAPPLTTPRPMRSCPCGTMPSEAKCPPRNRCLSCSCMLRPMLKIWHTPYPQQIRSCSTLETGPQ